MLLDLTSYLVLFITTIMNSIRKHDILVDLQGKELRIPNLDTILSPFDSGISPQYEALVKLMDSRINELIKDPHVRDKVNKVNLPLFVAR